MSASINRLSNSLQSVQDIIIGIYVDPTKRIELIVSKGDYTFKTVSVGSLFGLSISNYPLNRVIHLFPDNKTLSEMMQDPIEFDKWCKENINI